MQKKYKLNILIAGQTLLLLAVSLGVLFYFSHKALKNEAQLPLMGRKLPLSLIRIK